MAPGRVSPEAARATVAAHPEDWRALRLVARAVRGTPEAAQALDRLCSMAGGTAPECSVAQHRAAPTAAGR